MEASNSDSWIKQKKKNSTPHSKKKLTASWLIYNQCEVIVISRQRGPGSISAKTRDTFYQFDDSAEQETSDFYERGTHCPHHKLGPVRSGRSAWRVVAVEHIPGLLETRRLSSEAISFLMCAFYDFFNYWKPWQLWSHCKIENIITLRLGG